MDNQIIEIFCDGACRGNGSPEARGSWGAVIKLGEKKKEFSGILENRPMTNQVAELMAAINALKQLKTDEYQIKVFTDSAYIVNCFKDCWYKKWQETGWKTSEKKTVANKELWWELLALWVWYDAEFEYQSDSNAYIARAHELAQAAFETNWE